jgi:glycosyltransferase involved in cell wall biosynthesis
MVRTMVRGSDAWIAVGTRSRDYLIQLGARRDKVSVAFSTVDVQHFRSLSRELAGQRDQLKAQFGIRSSKIVLYVGQFIERKGLHSLIEAFAHVQVTQTDAALVLLGYGPQREQLAAHARAVGIANFHVLDHVDVKELPRVYSVADVFVLPSLEDTWGLVVNEAMASGLPVIVSDHAGASADLVREGENGFVVRAGDAVELGDRICRLLADDSLRAGFGHASIRLIDERFTPEHAAAAFVDAVECAVHRR